MTSRAPIRSVGLCVKPGSEQAGESARGLVKWLEARAVETVLDRETAHFVGRPGVERTGLAERVDLVVVLGGDGTILAAARDTGSRGVPILGVNLGTLGFLAEVAPADLTVVLERVLRGDFQTVRRMRLHVRARRGDRELADALALNDAVITRGELSRLIDLESEADGVPVTTYHGDGLIVATPTGSTAYTLSAGGPILMPGSRVFVVTPICPHALTQRPLVLSDDTRLQIRALPREGGARLTVDGQIGLALERGDVVTIEVSEHPVTFVASPFRTRFEVLREKLGWGAA
jgi:NAD+ kinase